MSQTLPVYGFKWVENASQFIEDVTENCTEDSGEGYFLEVDFQYPEKLDDLHIDLFFQSQRMKIEKFQKLVAHLHKKKGYLIDIRNFKDALNHGLVTIKVHRAIKFDEKALIIH